MTTLIASTSSLPGNPASAAGHYPMQTSAGEVFSSWNGVVAGFKPPEPHKQKLMDSVQRVLDSGLHYNSDVVKAVIEDLGAYLRPEDAVLGLGKVENGFFGCEIFMARKRLDKIKLDKMVLAAGEKLALAPGALIGTLVFNDFKRTTGCVVDTVNGHHQIKITGKRGTNTVCVVTHALSIQSALDRAFEKGMRKSAYLVAPKAVAKPAAGGLVATDSVVVAPVRRRIKP